LDLDLEPQLVLIEATSPLKIIYGKRRRHR
jgi:hypothetical protein